MFERNDNDTKEVQQVLDQIESLCRARAVSAVLSMQANERRPERFDDERSLLNAALNALFFQTRVDALELQEAVRALTAPTQPSDGSTVIVNHTDGE